MKASLFVLCLLSSLLLSTGFWFGPRCPENPERSCKAFINGSIQVHENFRGFRTPDFIKHYGYPVEEHNIITDDQYILTYYRIPGKIPNAIPVLLMHGILASSVQWFLQPAHKSLVFMLHEAGYDVWVGNSRGTSYSNGHTSMSPIMNLGYWDFSSYEMGKYDVPAAVDYILASTAHSSIYYIGHSLGGQQAFIAASLNSDINTKIRTIFALGPAVYTGNTTNPNMNRLASVAAPYRRYNAFNHISRGQYFPAGIRRWMSRGSQLCRSSLMNCAFCARAFESLVGSDPCQANYVPQNYTNLILNEHPVFVIYLDSGFQTFLPVIASQLPDRTSFKLWSHCSQAIISGEFREYDYGPWKNMMTYGRLKPPDYSWRNVKIPTVLLWGENDNFVVPQDIAKTAAALGDNLKEYIQVPHSKWTHLDFLFAVDADIFVYNKILDIMNAKKYG